MLKTPYLILLIKERKKHCIRERKTYHKIRLFTFFLTQKMFVHLHGYSTYSFLEAIGKPKDIVKNAKSL